jgi:type IX secretion system substrate protein
MKKVTILLVLVLFALKGNAQEPDPRIFSTWYILEYIEGGVSYFPPDAYPIEIFEEGDQNCPHYFYFPNPWHSSGGCIGSVTETQFVIQWLGILTEGEICQGGPPECEAFFSKYRPLYADAEITGDPLSYVIEDLQNNKRRLIVTNLNGDQAIYSNQYLSINDYSGLRAVVYPNPVNDELFVVSNTQIKKVRVYSLQGKLILETSSLIINFSSFHNGLYFVETSNNQGKEIHKIIKK